MSILNVAKPNVSFTREELDRYRHLLPEEELETALMWMNNTCQRVIAGTYAVTQAAICYRLSRLRGRIDWLAFRPPRPPTFTEDLLAVFDNDVQRATVVEDLVEFPHQSMIAKKWGLKQGRVRHWFMYARARLKGPSLVYLSYTVWNILHTYPHGSHNTLKMPKNPFLKHAPVLTKDSVRDHTLGVLNQVIEALAESTLKGITGAKLSINTDSLTEEYWRYTLDLTVGKYSTSLFTVQAKHGTYPLTLNSGMKQDCIHTVRSAGGLAPELKVILKSPWLALEISTWVATTQDHSKLNDQTPLRVRLGEVLNQIASTLTDSTHLPEVRVEVDTLSPSSGWGYEVNANTSGFKDMLFKVESCGKNEEQILISTHFVSTTYDASKIPEIRAALQEVLQDPGLKARIEARAVINRAFA